MDTLISTDDARRQLGTETDITTLQHMIAAAEELIEQHLSRRIHRGEYVDSFRDTSLCMLRAFPIAQLTAVTGDGADITGESELDEERGILYLPRLYHRVQVRYSGGFASGEVPEPIRQACLLTVSALHSALESGGREVVSETLEGYSVSYARTGSRTPGMSTLSAAAAALLSPYKGRAAL